MKTCVAIELDSDTGAVTVGVLPPEAAGQYQLEPAQSVDEALSTAKSLLSGQTGEQTRDAMAEQEAFVTA